MFVCSLCAGGKTQFLSGKSYLEHFSFCHSQFIGKGTMVCSFTGCIGRTFDKYNSFRKHVMNHKLENGFPPAQIDTPSQNDLTIDQNGLTKSRKRTFSDISVDVPFPDTPSDSNVNNDATIALEESDEDPVNSVTFDQKLNQSVVTYLAGLYDCGYFKEAQIQYVIDSQMELLRGPFLSVLKNNVFECLEKAKNASVLTSHEISNIARMFDSFQEMFKGYESHYLRLQEFEQSGAYIKPQSFVIGNAQTEKYVNGDVIMDPISLTGQFIPFREVLKGFLELPNVLPEIQDYVSYLENSFSESGPIENFIQGTLWREKIKPKFEGKQVFPLKFSFDDYETNKELGTHTGVHKMGAGYISLACLPPKFSSSLENLFLAVLFHSADRAFGNKAVFRKVIEEIQFLEEVGILVCTPNGVVQVYFTLALVCGDNLGANGILEYVESFTANFFCRVCSESNAVTKAQTEPNLQKIRTPETYESDLVVKNESLTGRKGPCVFNEVKGFHVCENFHLDSMHDLDEGVWKYEMYLIVKYFYDKKRFSIDYLNEIIQGFKYGVNEERNKPPLISHEDLCVSKRLRLSASEMRCLFRYFSVMFGHLVKEEDFQVWNLYLKGRSILDFATAPVVSKHDIELLKGLIKEHHTEYIRIFKTHLKPKFHFLIHYPDVMIQVGPLDLLSCYRSESKHMEGKDVARGSHSRVNLPLTIAKRHQLKLAFRFLAARGLKSRLDYSVVQNLRVERLAGYCEFQSVIPPEHDKKVWNCVKWVEINGTKYTLDSVVLHSFNQTDLPVFGSVRVISVHKDECYFVLHVLDIICFEKHYHAFEVKEGTQWLFVNAKNLLTHVPTNQRFINGKVFVTFRFSVDCLRQLTH